MKNSTVVFQVLDDPIRFTSQAKLVNLDYKVPCFRTIKNSGLCKKMSEAVHGKIYFTFVSVFGVIDICEYYRHIGKLHEHPECARQFSTPAPTTAAPRIGFCSSSAALIQCTADAQTCPLSGQVCIQSDGNKCCQIVTAGIPASEINSKSGSCPRPLGISVLQDTTIGCWMDSNCPGIQKCCVEPNPVTNSATRICRDPVGIASKKSTSICSLPLAVGSCTAPAVRFYYDASSGRCNQFMFSGCGGNANNFQSLASCQATCGQSGVVGTPACPNDANAGLNCLFAHADACNSDSDCLGRENTAQPSCCMTSCGYKICYQY
uniref:BPTI/Kunitz inhibitor domain-containing protein n=1 Tax=Caenorhabditis tropicalis TaxID=1561998 RepID=A0A1I7T4Y6_9PELO